MIPTVRDRRIVHVLPSCRGRTPKFFAATYYPGHALVPPFGSQSARTMPPARSSRMRRLGPDCSGLTATPGMCPTYARGEHGLDPAPVVQLGCKECADRASTGCRIDPVCCAVTVCMQRPARAARCCLLNEDNEKFPQLAISALTLGNWKIALLDGGESSSGTFLPPKTVEKSRSYMERENVGETERSQGLRTCSQRRRARPRVRRGSSLVRASAPHPCLVRQGLRRLPPAVAAGSLRCALGLPVRCLVRCSGVA